MSDSPSLTNPDLTFYYSMSPLAGTVTNISNTGSDSNVSTSAYIYDTIPPIPPNVSESIGFMCLTGTKFNVTTPSVDYKNITNQSFFLQNGTITFLQNILSVKDSQGHFIFPPNSVYVYSITSASGGYIGKTGFIKITTDEYKNRKIEVYFTKTYTATASASASATRQSGETIIQSATASATSTVSEEDAYQIALVNASGLANALANASAVEPN
jgi:hypothetical protein